MDRPVKAMGILDGIVEWIAEQIMYGLDLINTSVLGALGCDMNTFLRYFPAAETMYSLLVALAIGLILLGWVWNLFKNYGLGLGVDAEDPVKLTAKAILFIVLAYCRGDQMQSNGKGIDHHGSPGAGRACSACCAKAASMLIRTQYAFKTYNAPQPTAIRRLYGFNTHNEEMFQ